MRGFVGKDKHNHTETDLHLGLFEKRVQNDLRVRVLFDVDYDAETVTVGFVLNVRNALYSLVFDLVGDIFDKARLVDLIRKFGNDDSRPAVCHFFDFGAGADYAAAATGFVCLTNGRTAENYACRRKIGRGNEFHKVFDFQFGISIRATVASITSPRLCGGMDVAIPTAIPSEPFTRRLG